MVFWDTCIPLQGFLHSHLITGGPAAPRTYVPSFPAFPRGRGPVSLRFSALGLLLLMPGPCLCLLTCTAYPNTARHIFPFVIHRIIELQGWEELCRLSSLSLLFCLKGRGETLGRGLTEVVTQQQTKNLIVILWVTMERLQIHQIIEYAAQ